MSRRVVGVILLLVVLVGSVGAFLWGMPRTITVVRGDTLGEIATREQVTLADLRSWNGLQGDRIEVGQTLIVRPGRFSKSTPELASEPPTDVKHSHAKPVSPPSTARSFKPLRRPSPKRCLDAADGAALGEHDAVGSAGLDDQQLRAATQGFLPEALRCVPEGGLHHEGTIAVAMVVGCDGQVDRVTVDDSGGFPTDVVDCVADVLRYMPFPAHDQPDGFEFQLPVHLAD